MDYKYYKQETDWTCGPACLRMYFSAIGGECSEEDCEKVLNTKRPSKQRATGSSEEEVGTSYKAFEEFAKGSKIKFIAKQGGEIIDLKKALKKDLFVIVSYHIIKDNINHFAVVKIVNDKEIILNDPSYGKGKKIELKHFEKIWSIPARFSKEKNWFIAMGL